MKQTNTADVWKHEQEHLREIKLQTPEIQLLRAEHTLTFRNIFLFGFLQSKKLSIATQTRLRERQRLSCAGHFGLSLERPTQTNPVQ